MIDERIKSVLENLISCVNVIGSVDLDPYTGLKINYCSIMCMTKASMTYTVTFIYLHASLFLNIITSKWHKLCRAALMAMTVACNDCTQ